MAKQKQTRRMIAMALAAAVTMTSMPVVAFADEVDPAPAAETPAPSIGATVAVTPDNPATPDTDESVRQAEVTTEDNKTITVTVTANANAADQNSTVDFVTNATDPSGNDDDLVYEGVNGANSGQYNDLENFLPGVNEPAEDDAADDADDTKFDEKDEVNPEEDFNEYDDDSQYEFVTQGATSQFRPLSVYTQPMTDEEKFEQHGFGACIHVDEYYSSWYVNQLSAEVKATIAKNEDGTYVTKDGYLVDGNGNYIMKKETSIVGADGKTYYMHKFDASGNMYKIEGAYNDADKDGTWEKDSVVYKGNWEEAAQYVLIDKETGELITTYSEDYYVKKPGMAGVGYDMVDLDGRYFDENGNDLADDIRAIAQAGYWGTESGLGSLDAMKKNLLTAGFTAAELESLTDGVALAATQMAICSKTKAEYGIDYLNTKYATNVDADGLWTEGKINQNNNAVPSEKADEAALLFKLYDYLRNLKLDPAVEEEAKNEIYTNDNFLKNMEVTVLEKATGDDVDEIIKKLNSDNNNDNDAYKTNVTFALVVTPGAGDDLVVSLVGSDGKTVETRRIAGENKPDENYDYLKADKDGNYTFEGVILMENGVEYHISMAGVQNLAAGNVVVFAAQEDNVHNSNRTVQPDMIGMANKNTVNVHSLGFSFDVKGDEVVVKRRPNKTTTTTTTTTTENTDVVIEEQDVPLADGEVIFEIEEDDVPLTNLPDLEEEGIVLGAEDVVEDDGVVAGAEDELIAATGDSNHMTAGFGGMFAALAGMMMLRKKREN